MPQGGALEPQSFEAIGRSVNKADTGRVGVAADQGRLAAVGMGKAEGRKKLCCFSSKL